jgi:uncharacterized glyoxalase superfamily protein PhnB
MRRDRARPPSLAPVNERAFPVIYSRDVEGAVRFYAGELGFEEHFRLPPEDVDTRVERPRGAGVEVLKAPADMPWGERVAYVAAPAP